MICDYDLGPPIPICTTQGTTRQPVRQLSTLMGYRATKHFVIAKKPRGWQVFNGHGRAGPAFYTATVAVDFARDLETLAGIDWTLPAYHGRPPEVQAIIDKYRHLEA